MLDDYLEQQPIVYKLLTAANKKGETVHAYLFQTNGFFNAEKMAVAFAKTTICPHSYTNANKCQNCNVCHRIETGNFSELKIIKPDGLWIKKDQLMELQKNFNKKAIEGSKKIYIITEAEKLNSSSANSILKFLEEPEENIFAILLTEDINKVLKTITSRCQTIVFKPNKIEDYLNIYDKIENDTLLKFGIINKSSNLEEFISEEKNKFQIENVLKFIIEYESKGINVLLDTKNLWHDNFKEKSDMLIGFDIIILFYKDVLNYLNINNLDIFSYYETDVIKVAKLNNKNNIIKKIKAFVSAKEKIKYNVNINLLIDQLIINLEGGAK